MRPNPFRLSALRARRQQAGFSLIELVVVVIIIAALAALAVPMATERLRDRRTQGAANRVADMYRIARMRAMGRGAAVAVIYDNAGGPQGAIEVREAVRGTTDPNVNCQVMPVSSCQLTNWGNGAPNENRVTDQLNLDQRSEYQDVRLKMLSTSGTAVSHLEVCFTPLGRTFVRLAGNAAWTPLAGVPVAEVSRVDAANVTRGLTRSVMVLPNGAARLGTSR